MCPLSQCHLHSCCTLDWHVSPPLAQLCDLGVPAEIKGCQRCCVLCVFRVAFTGGSADARAVLSHLLSQPLWGAPDVPLHQPAQNGRDTSPRSRLEE